MSRIEQAYLTHCTPETSVFGRFSGFSVRAGSLPPETLKEIYHHVLRPMATYALPPENPASEPATETAGSAPVRLIFQPDIEGYRVLGRVCHRPPEGLLGAGMGNYFGHFLFAPNDPGGPRWSTLDALRVWGADGWVSVESASIPRELPALSRLDELQGEAPLAIGEDTFRSFLNEPAGGPFHDPGSVIPPRWREAEPRRRRELFERLLEAFLDADLRRPGGLRLAAEPGLAALLFFGLFRTVPSSIFEAPTGFSTYDHDRPGTPVTASTRRDSSRLTAGSKGSVDAFTVTTPVDVGGYPRLVVDLLLAGGWPALDPLIEAGARAPADLKPLAVAFETLRHLEPETGDVKGMPSPSWPPGSPADHLARRMIRQWLGESGLSTTELRRVAGSPLGPTLLRNLCGDESAPEFSIVAAHLRLEDLDRVLLDAEVPRKAKVKALSASFEARGRLTPGLEKALAHETIVVQSQILDIFSNFLARTRPEAFGPAINATDGPARLGIYRALLDRTTRDPSSREAVRGLLASACLSNFCELVQSRGPVIESLYRDRELDLNRLANRFFEDLVRQPGQIVARLEGLSTLLGILPAAEKDRLDAWLKLGDVVRRLDRATASGPHRGLTGWRKLLGAGPDPVPGLLLELEANLNAALRRHPIRSDPAATASMLDLAFRPTQEVSDLILRLLEGSSASKPD